MSISKIKHATKSLKTFQGINFESCLDNGNIAEQTNKWLLEVSWEVANKGFYRFVLWRMMNRAFEEKENILFSSSWWNLHSHSFESSNH